MSKTTKARHEKLGLSREDLIEMYRLMLLARKIDERLWILNRSGKVPFVISGQGHEAAQVGISYAMDRSKDYVVPYYRDLATLVSFGVTPYEAFLGSLGKAGDPASNGRQMPSHYGDKAKRILSGSGPVATQCLHAAGVALGAKLSKDPVVTYTSLGEGSTSEGDFHEGLNFAAVRKLGVIFVVQNNEYAISVPEEEQYACKSLADKGVGYGMPAFSVDGTDILAVYEVAKEAAERARSGEGPTLIETKVVRLTSHSSDDDQRKYRSKEDLQRISQNDPVQIFRSYLLENALMSEEEEEAMHKTLKEQIDRETDQALEAPDLKAEDALGYVYAQ